MEKLFSQILNMSLTGSVVISLIICVRFALKRSPKIYSYLLWSVVLFRLLCPVSFSSSVSMLEVLKPQVVETSSETSIVSYIPMTPDLSVSSNAEVEHAPDYSESYTPAMQESKPNVLEYASLMWAAGAMVLILYSLMEYAKLRSRLVGAMVYRGNVYLADHIDTPFVMGILSPKIYLPTSVPKEERKFIIAHERHHIRRCDHIIKLFSFAALCLHWFNPLVWVAFIMSGKDMEMSCDEAVIRKLGPQIRADYSAALLRMSTHRQIISGMPLGFGEGDMKGRVLNMSKWKKPKVWVSVICLLLCVVVLAACVLNPKEKQNLEEMTKTTGPASVGVGNLYFTIPEGYTIETRESEVQPKGELFRYEHVIRKDDAIVGGVYKLKYPDSNWADYWDWVFDLNVPENVPEERLLMTIETRGQFKGHPYSLAAFYGKEGVVETIHYLFNGDNLVYDLWFSMELLSEDEKNQILDTVTFEKSTWDGHLKLELPDGYDFNLDKQGNLIFTDGLNTIGGKTVYTVPEGFELNEYFSEEFMVALGIPEATDKTLGYFGGGSGLGVDGFGIEYFSDVPPGERRDVHTYHQFFVMNDGITIYDIWFDLLYVDASVKDTVISSIEIPEIGRERQTAAPQDFMETIPSVSAQMPFEFRQLPTGFSYDVLGENCILLIGSGNVVGGIDAYVIPEGVYDPFDEAFIWLEDVGIPDFEDPTLCYMGGMTSGDNGWLAEFASDVPEGVERTVHRRHHFYAIGEKVYDIWFDMLLIDYNAESDILACIRLPSEAQQEAELAGEVSAEDLAFEKTSAVMDAVAEGGCSILQTETSDSNEGPSGYERIYHFHDGNLLYTSTVLTEGENINEAGEYYNRYALLYVDDTFYDNAGSQGNPGDIQWVTAQPPEEIPVPWLGNHVWVKSYVTYIDTMKDETGECLMFRFDAPYEDQEGYAPVYWVNFYFDPDGNFRYVKLNVNLFQDNEFTITESILSLDADAVSAEIDREYQRALN